jgi:serine/threonine-protein kinase
MIGVRLGPWVIDSEIGRGGMGAVYAARRAPDAGDGPPVAAVKVLAAELAVEVGFQQRFQREIDILRQLNHPNIIRFYDSGVESARFYYAMEYVPGPSFEELRNGQDRLPWPEVLDLALQVAPALKHAHDRGIVHRDLKPSNLLRSEDPAAPGVVKLADFGIASLFASPHLTVTGGVIGTPEYLSPEQAAGKPVTPRSDLYSLGVLLYTLLTGEPPFRGETLDLLHKHRFAQFDRPGRIVTGLPPDLDDVVCALLEKDPARRPGDAGVLARRLASIRRKLDRKAHQAEGRTAVPGAAGPVPAREGPATMVSRIVRQELHELNHGGPLRQFFHRPPVLVTLFLLCAGTLAWTFWPMSPETLFRRGAELMASADPDDWERAWDKYLTPLETRHPDHAHADEVREFRRRLLDARRLNAGAHRIGEARWFYERALRARQRGEEAEARRLLAALVEAFRHAPGEKAWVKRAKDALAQPGGAPPGGGLDALRAALQRARALDAEGQADEAKAVRRGLAELYRGDAAAEKCLAADEGAGGGKVKKE